MLVCLLFLSTFFVGCKPHEEPIISLDDDLKQSTKIVDRTPLPEEVAIIDQSEEKTIKKEISDENSVNIILEGRVFTPEGLPFTNAFSIMMVSSDSSDRIRRYRTAIKPDAYGSYEYSGLSQGVFNIYFYNSRYKNFVTNLCILPPRTELDFSFSEFPVAELCGIVVHEADNEPIEGVLVNGHTQRSETPYISCFTDSKGEFSIKLKEIHDDYFGEITVNEPGFGKVIKQIRSKDKYIKIVLRQAGNIIGKVMTENGLPLAEAYVSINGTGNNQGYVKSILATSENEYFYYRTRTDSDGNYSFENIIAPAKYNFDCYVRSNDFVINNANSDDRYSVELEPERTLELDIIMKKVSNSILAIKGIDNQDKPVLKYNFKHKISVKDDHGFRAYSKINVDVSEDEWFYFVIERYSKGFFGCTAFNSEKKLAVTTNNIPFSANITNYITLVFSTDENILNLTGFLLKPDGSPAINCNVRAWNAVHDRTDEKGYFELKGMIDLKKGDNMSISASSWSDKFFLSTNLPSGAKNVRLKFFPPCRVSGKVFLGNLETPAKRFVVSQSYNKQSYNSEDGSFVFTMKKPTERWLNYGQVTISVDGYLPGFGKYNFTKLSSCDVGNIILRTGETANIKGRVITQNDEPVNVQVRLWNKADQTSFQMLSSIKDGSYCFEGIPPGEWTVLARSRLGFKDSHEFNIEEGEELELPDLIINFTNSALVTFTVKLPDGTSPKNSRINGHYIKNDGTFRRSMLEGTYSGWKMNYNGKDYISDDFEVMESTEKLEIWMREK